MSIWRHADFLPKFELRHRITLGEANTPLLHSRRIGPVLGLPHLYFKLENCNPTGSFKDRFAVVAASDMAANAKAVCLATSSGNTGAALAAACAVAGIRCYVAVVDGAPQNKLRNMQVYGAHIYTVRGFGRDAAVTAGVMDRLRQLCEQRGAALQISAYRHSPVGMTGCETIAYELHDQLEGRVDHVFTQAGGGGMTWAIIRGFQRLHELGRNRRVPAVHCVQPIGNDTIAGPLRRKEQKAREVVCTTNVSGLQVPNVIDGDHVIAACRSCGGNGYPISDELVFETQRRLAREEGVFTEPAGAVSVAGLVDAARRGEVHEQDRIVCTVTGIGFKDETSLASMVKEAVCPCLDAPAALDDFLPSS
jgi:threonine synthase